VVGNAFVSINVVDLRRGRLVLGWVTVRGFESHSHHIGTQSTTQFNSVWPSLRGRRNEYQPPATNQSSDSLQNFKNKPKSHFFPFISNAGTLELDSILYSA